MRESLSTATQSSNFGLKNEVVALLPAAGTGRTILSLTELESMRTATLAVPASRHGLEVICGASCETGAQ